MPIEIGGIDARGGAAQAKEALREGGPHSSTRDPALWRAAQSFEAVFIAEMMSQAGLSTAGAGAGGGGFAEETFRSLLSREWAEDMSANGGFGLAEQIYRNIASVTEA